MFEIFLQMIIQMNQFILMIEKSSQVGLVLHMKNVRHRIKKNDNGL
jgi:hypothetical protein